jgi:replicative DNA helicase
MTTASLPSPPLADPAGTLQAPHSAEVERAVVSQMLADPKRIAEVVGTTLEPRHFYGAPGQILYEALYARFYADDPMDPLSVGEACSRRLATAWGISEDDAIVRVQQLAQGSRWDGEEVTDHAKLVKRDADYRELLDVASSMRVAVGRGELTPEEIASKVSQDAMEIATNTVKAQETVSFADGGREFVTEMRRVMEARKQGIELGATFGLDFIDRWTGGIQPTELLIGAGAPGSGKSWVWSTAAMKFAERQLKLPPAKRVGTLILSLEMGRWPNFVRIAQMLSGVPTRYMRTGDLDAQQLSQIVNSWGRKRELPLWFNFASQMRLSQLRAVLAEAVRRHNIGLVIIDHMRMVQTDHYIRDANERDEEKARFFKQALADDLNLAVVCIAHTVKMTNLDSQRPTMDHLRGGGMISAYADHICFIYRPWKHATEEQRDSHEVSEHEAEMVVAKNRHEAEGVFPFHCNLATAEIR